MIDVEEARDRASALGGVLCASEDEVMLMKAEAVLSYLLGEVIKAQKIVHDLKSLVLAAEIRSKEWADTIERQNRSCHSNQIYKDIT